MQPDKLSAFDEIWSIDTEYRGDSGNPYDVVCIAGVELRSGRRVALWRTELGAAPPFRIDSRSLIVCFAATAELGSFLSLDWPLPAKLLDLSPEYRLLVNGRADARDRRGLLDALQHYGLMAMAKGEKDYWRDMVLRGGPYMDDERTGILNYCLTDADSAAALLSHMLPALDLPRALLRSEFVKVSAIEEYRGIPLDMDVFGHLRDPATWDEIRETLIPGIDTAFNVFEGRVFKRDRFERYLAQNKVPWPRLESGQLDLRDKTFRERAKAFPQIAPLHELRHTLSKMRRIKIQAGADGRARTVLWPFASKTSRTQPKATQYLFGPSCWLRSLLKPRLGTAIAYVDWSAMEFGIAGGLSNDETMREAYDADPYLSTAIAFGHAPAGATKATHGPIRDNFKVVILAAQYGMEAASLAGRLGISTIEANEILLQHRRLYAKYWQWSDAWLHRALSSGQMWTCFGWTRYLDQPESARSIRNWPIQSHGAEILRIAVIWANRYGLRLLGTVHDAILIEAPIDRIDRDVALLQEIMRRASRVVLSAAGQEFALRASATIVRYPRRYSDPRGALMWRIVSEHLATMQRDEGERRATG